jgi:hypothetical protein
VDLVSHINGTHRKYTREEIARVGLADFEKDQHQHIHLENNLLFPRAIEMERAHRKEQAQVVRTGNVHREPGRGSLTVEEIFEISRAREKSLSRLLILYITTGAFMLLRGLARRLESARDQQPSYRQSARRDDAIQMAWQPFSGDRRVVGKRQQCLVSQVALE